MSSNSTDSKEVRKFARKLEALGLPLNLIDERYSSSRATEVLHRMGRKTGTDKGAVDRIAAALILEDFLNGAY